MRDRKLTRLERGKVEIRFDRIRNPVAVGIRFRPPEGGLQTDVVESGGKLAFRPRIVLEIDGWKRS